MASVTSNAPQPFSCLVLLDLNGTLVYRSIERVNGVKETFRGQNKKFVYKRRGVDDLILGLTKCGFTVCILSSMAIHNVTETVAKTLSPEAREAIKALLTGKTYHLKDRSAGAADHDTVRNPEAVWKAFPSFSAVNTVFVDDEARKFELAPRCGILMPQLGANFLERDEDIPSLLKHFQLMAAEAPSDVQEWMEAHPWEKSTPITTAAAAEPMPPSPELARLPATPAPSAALSPFSSPSSRASPFSPTRGVSLRIVCIENGRFTLAGNRTDSTVTGPADAPFRLDAKMDYKRLLESAVAHKVELEIIDPHPPQTETSLLEASFARLAVSPAAALSPEVSSPASKASPSSPGATGVELQIVCIENGRFTYSGKRADFKVKGPTNVPFRLDATMAYQRLIDEAREHKVELDIVDPQPSPLRSKGKQQKKPTPPTRSDGGGV